MADDFYNLTLKEYPEELRPRERLCRYGVKSLSDQELLALLLSTGYKNTTALDLANNILKKHSGLKGLIEITIEELSDIQGIGKAKGAKIMSAIEIGRRISSSSKDTHPSIRSPKDVSQLVMNKLRYLDREHLEVLLLNTKAELISLETVSVGTLNSSLVHPREVFKFAVKKSAASIILVHNHPSGDPNPSKEDILITKRIFEAGRLLGISLLDHIVIGDNKYCSLKQEGVI